MIDPTMFGDFPKADPVERGCGEREPGGVYAESGLSPWGRPLEEFLLDPPLPLPDGLDLVNKPQLWQRMLPSGEPALDEQGQPIHDLLIWVGAEHYEYVPDFLEEVRRYGASRRLNPNLDLARLSRASRMLLAHPLVINTLWQEQQPPQQCGKNVPGHAAQSHSLISEEDEDERDEDEWEWEESAASKETSELTSSHPLTTALTGLSTTTILPVPSPLDTTHAGPCLFKVWELIPVEAAQTVITLDGEEGKGDERPLCLREIGSTVYQYRPTGESADGLVPGLFAALPITGFALIRFADGSVNEKAKQKMMDGLQAHQEHAIPFYESDR
jgi:hypothetical protein